ncbi:Uu.00g055710.m01.CDS01 [Anthostomella pinea]|uniref:Uu.00g055710.m01.CDS01 n=1 Tax=Anthostomella pinea TaxID=933095 RepID=A0AAI8VWV9_9PEZI|nr:Uu.00g055710.m01.CDS01 [Anthostomella pinea]
MPSASTSLSPVSPGELLAIEDSLGDSHFLRQLDGETSRVLIDQFARHVVACTTDRTSTDGPEETSGELPPPDLNTHAIRLGLASLAAFLQANVTGPVLESPEAAERIFVSSFSQADPSHVGGQRTLEACRVLCQRSLDTDGVSTYSYIPHIELFCLARFIFTSGRILPIDTFQSLASQLSWTRLRIHLWHYKLLTQPSLGPGSLFTKSGRWTDVVTLQELIEQSLKDAESAVFRTSHAESGLEEPPWPQESRVQFRLEQANCHILLGNDTKAKQALQAATQTSDFVYALSGALGKRTRFQETNISQLVVLAKSLHLAQGPDGDKDRIKATPVALSLNDDTLLENIKFNGDEAAGQPSSVQAELQDITPDNQPELRPEDQIILLTEATLKDTFLPVDSLTSEEILPFAVRVIEDKAANWQVYTQALLVRSRIEMNRSRTVERGVLQMQALVDQVLVNTQESAASVEQSESKPDPNIPVIQVTSEGQPDKMNKPTSFLPAPKPSESASPKERLRYVNALASPPRWHLESELAYAWSSVGSLVSALEIFKRLRLWPEVALCLASTAATDDADGRGAGGEEKARAVVRWRLFHRTPSTGDDEGDVNNGDVEEDDIDISSLKPSDFYGPEHSPPPPNAPRLFCLLGDMENDAQHYKRAWDVSNRRFARAQRSLGELYLQRKEWNEAREAYTLSVAINRMSPELWGRLGDIELRLGHFPDAAEAFQRGLSTANDTSGGENARTWSNLGTALLSWYREIVEESKARKERLKNDEDDSANVDDMPSTKRAAELGRSAPQLLRDSLIAFKRGATIADSNWRIWDNVVTLAASLSTPDIDDIVLGLRSIIRIRKAEDALDLDILALLVREATKTPISGDDAGLDGVYEPARGTAAHRIIAIFEDDIVPLITSNSACWALVSRLRAWRRDWAGALDAAEKGWRAAIGGVGSSLSASSAGGEQGNWLTDVEEWDTVVQRTSELVAAYENYGSRLESVGTRWKGKARSAIRSVLGKAKESWEEDERWDTLQGMMQDLK